MRFSEIQKKEVIDTAKGAFLGFIEDATIDIVNGKVESFHVSEGERGLFFDAKERNTKKVRLEDITTIGKDIVLVGKMGGNK